MAEQQSEQLTPVRQLEIRLFSFVIPLWSIWHFGCAQGQILIHSVWRVGECVLTASENKEPK